MHELAIAREIVAVAERYGKGLPVGTVRVRVGRLRQVVPEYLGFYFDVAAQGTSCESAELEWEQVPSLLRCGDCGLEWDPAPPPASEEDELLVGFRCPDCRSADHAVVSGDELLVESIDVEDPVPGPDGKAAPAVETGGG